MRMRKKKHCAERMERCACLWIKNPSEYKGRWSEVFTNSGEIHVEIGAGKGAFVCGMARLHPEVNYVAVERVDDVLVIAMERAVRDGLENVRFCSMNAEKLADVFAPAEIDRIYLNFSDPWKKSNQAKRRLTHGRFLDIYKRVLKPGGMIAFKTDNQKLFEFSLNSFAAADLKMQNITFDLHKSGIAENVMTEYETRFAELGQPIYRAEAIYKGELREDNMNFDIDLNKEQYTTEDLLKIMEILRSENGCPWDKVQTHQSIKTSLIEEAYEAIDALDSGDDHAFANELGDVLLQVVFHARIAEEEGRFDYNTVLNEICRKLISRHTHVFGNDAAGDDAEALARWEKNKAKEKSLKSTYEALDDVPHSLPALMRAQKLQKKAIAAGKFSTDNAAEYVIDRTEQIQASTNAEEQAKLYAELLFSVAALGRKIGANAETTLADECSEFVKSFENIG